MQIIKNKKIIILSIVFLFFVGCLGLTSVVEAQSFGSASGYLDNIASRVDLQKKDISSIIGGIINGVLGFLGIVSLALIIYAGLRLMMAGGSEETVQAARATIKWALIGLIVVIGAYALSYYVVSQVLEATIKPPLRPDMIDGYSEEDELLGYDCSTFYCAAYSGTDQEMCLGPKDDSGQPCCTWREVGSVEYPLEEYSGECVNG